MRKFPALLTVLGLATLTLAGCTAGDVSGCTPPPHADAELQAQFDVSGEPGSDPRVSFGTPFHADVPQTWETVEGTGTRITSDDQLVALDVAVFDGMTGSKLISTPFDGDTTRTFTVAAWADTFPEIGALLSCAAEGSRVVLALPPGGVAPETAAALGLGADDSTVAVVDVSRAYLPRAEGALVFNNSHNLPSVVRAPSGQPGVIVPDTSAPGDIVVQTLIRGGGPVVGEADAVRVNYTGVPWQVGGDVFDTTWGASPAAVQVSAAQQPGFADALTGQTVGSQVLVVVPADQVVAGAAMGVPADTAVVYVIDILGVDDAAPLR